MGTDSTEMPSCLENAKNLLQPHWNSCVSGFQPFSSLSTCVRLDSQGTWQQAAGRSSEKYCFLPGLMSKGEKPTFPFIMKRGKVALLVAKILQHSQQFICAFYIQVFNQPHI